MRGKVGTLIRDEMNRLSVLHYYRLKEHYEPTAEKLGSKVDHFQLFFFNFPIVQWSKDDKVSIRSHLSFCTKKKIDRY